MASKQVGLASVIKVDEDDSGSVFTTVSLIADFTPPSKTRVEVEATALEDTLQTNELGIEGVSYFDLTLFWHVGDTNHEIFDTLFTSKTAVLWQWLSPHSTVKTSQFEGKVVSLDNQTVQHNTTFLRKARIMRTGAITVS
jgi:hypothetical protein